MIVVDDGSTDSTLKILSSFAKKDKRIKILRNRKNLGVAGSLNKALKKASGQFIARMDADDICLPRRFEKQIALLKKNPSLVAVGTQTEIINENGEVVGYKDFPLKPEDCYRLMMLTVPIQHPTMMVRAKAIRKYGYQQAFKTAEDWDLYFKLLQEGQLGNTKERLYLYRQCFGSNGFKNIKKAFFLINHKEE